MTSEHVENARPITEISDLYSSDTRYPERGANEANDACVGTAENVALKSSSREKLQIRGLLRGSKRMRGALSPVLAEEEDEVQVGAIQARLRSRGRRGRGRGRVGRRVAEERNQSEDGDEASPLDGLSRGVSWQAQKNELIPTFEVTEEISQWLSEITLVSNWDFDALRAGVRTEIRLAFDDSSLSEHSISLPLFKSSVISDNFPIMAGEVPAGIRQPCSDLVLRCGGPVWALEWCPQRSGWGQFEREKSEFLAVGAHPSQVPYNRLGEPLRGRGLVQIWAFDFCTIDRLEVAENRADRGKGIRRDLSLRGGLSGSDLKESVILLEYTATAHSVDLCTKRSRSLRKSAAATENSVSNVGNEGPAKMILGLAHEGVVTWDAKWRPFGEERCPKADGRELLRLGFLALLLGDGSIQVIDVPLPSILTTQFRGGDVSSTDPMTVSIGPVFRSSHFESGGHKSIPLSLEWSTWDPHDILLVGFHDASVGLWKFSSNFLQPETRPLMFFVADTLPLRSVAWAPSGSGSAGQQIFVTAGHSGWVKFWDARDPFHPLWDLQVSRGCIHSLDWLPWPRCLVMVLDDGTLRILGLDNAVSQSLVIRKSFLGAHSNGPQCYLCSTFPIWDTQVSRSTGLVAYAGANGEVLQFQLTEKAIMKEGARAREPHYLCGAFLADSDDSPITLMSSKRAAPAQMKKSSTEWSSTPRTMRGFLATCTLDNESRQTSGSTRGVFKQSSKTESLPGPRIRKTHSKALGRIRHKDSSNLKINSKAEMPMVADDNMALIPLGTYDDVPGHAFYEEQKIPGAKIISDLSAAENFPSKTISVHRLTWNCNQNRQQWLAYGGAAGIVRCQQVFSMKKKQKGDF